MRLSGSIAADSYKYEGPPWRGELWLDDTLRLGPPSRQDETFLLSQRVILIDAQIDGIDQLDAGSVFTVRLRELSVFLSVVLRQEVRAPLNRRAWTWTDGTTSPAECDVRNLGYIEANVSPEMPAREQVPLVPLVPIQRPDFSLRGTAVGTGNVEQQLPSDIVDLWHLFMKLDPDRRQQFLQVGTMWQLGLSLTHEYQTGGFTYMVTACEALKPPGPQFRSHNIYDVVEALLSRATADLLREQWFRPQEVRSAHVHRGEFHGSEFAQHAMMSSFQDPTFDQARRVLGQITPAAIVEWLRRGGTFTMPPLKRNRTFRRWVKDHVLFVLSVLAVSGVAVGLVLGWFLRMFWHG